MNGRQNSKPNQRVTRRGGLIQAGPTGLQAAVIGWVLVGYILAGALLGYLLDSYFKTTFWTPVMFLFGVVAGFRDMHKTVSRLSSKTGQTTHIASDQETPVENRQSRESHVSGETQQGVAEEAVPRHKPRIFTVPPPPQPSFARRDDEPAVEKADQEPAADKPGADENLIERLLNDEQPRRNE